MIIILLGYSLIFLGFMAKAGPCAEGCHFCAESCLLCNHGSILTKEGFCETDLLSVFSEAKLDIYVHEDVDLLPVELMVKFKSLHEALTYVSNFIVTESLLSSKVNILLLKNLNKSMLFTPIDSTKKIIIHKKIDLEVKGLECSKNIISELSPFCFQEGEKLNLRILNEKVSIFFGRSLSIKNIHFDASDINMNATPLFNQSSCDRLIEKCCFWDPFSKDYRPIINDGSYSCINKTLRISAEKEAFKLNITSYENILSPFGLLNMIVEDEVNYPEFKMENCGFSDAYFFYLASFLKVGIKSYKIEIITTRFERFFFLDGVLSQNIFFLFNNPEAKNHLDYNYTTLHMNFLLHQLKFNSVPMVNSINLSNCTFLDGNHLKIIREEKTSLDEGYVIHSVLPYYNLSMEITETRFERSVQSYYEHCGEAYSNNSLFFYVDIIHFNELNLPIDYLKKRSSVINLKVIFIANLMLNGTIFEGNMGVTGASLLLICEVNYLNYQTFAQHIKDLTADFITNITIDNTSSNNNFAFFASPSFYLQLNPLMQNNLLVINSRISNNKGCYLGFYNFLVSNHFLAKNSQVIFKNCNFSRNLMRISSSLLVGYSDTITLTDIIFEENGVFGPDNYLAFIQQVQEARYDQWMLDDMCLGFKGFVKNAMFEAAAIFLERALYVFISGCKFHGNFGTISEWSGSNLQYINNYADIKISVIMFRGLLISNQTLTFDNCEFLLQKERLNFSEAKAFSLSQLKNSNKPYSKNFYPFIGTFTDGSFKNRSQDFFELLLSNCRFENNVFTDLHSLMNIVDIDTQINSEQLAIMNFINISISDNYFFSKKEINLIDTELVILTMRNCLIQNNVNGIEVGAIKILRTTGDAEVIILNLNFISNRWVSFCTLEDTFVNVNSSRFEFNKRGPSMEEIQYTYPIALINVMFLQEVKYDRDLYFVQNFFTGNEGKLFSFEILTEITENLMFNLDFRSNRIEKNSISIDDMFTVTSTHPADLYELKSFKDYPLYLSYLSSIVNNSFIENEFKNWGTMVSLLNVDSLIFTNNTYKLNKISNDSTLLFVQSSIYIIFQNETFAQNKLNYSNLIFLTQRSYAFFSGIKFRSNVCVIKENYICSLFEISFWANILLISISMQENICTNLFQGEDSTLIFIGSEIQLGEIDKGLDLLRTNLKLFTCNFIINTYGTLIKTDSCPEVSIFNSSFQGKANETRGATLIFIEKTESLTVSSSIFTQIHSDETSCLSVINTTTAILNHSKFIRNSARNSGGAVKLLYVSNIFMNRTRFHLNQAFEGGALYISTNSKVIKFDYCEFEANSAADDSVKKGYGGAIYFLSTNGSPIEINFCFFKKNKAYVGGGIYWFEIQPKIDKISMLTLRLRNNSAFLFGDCLATPPFRLVFLDNYMKFTFNKGRITVDEDLHNTTELYQYNFFSMVSGFSKDLSLLLFLVDFYGQQFFSGAQDKDFLVEVEFPPEVYFEYSQSSKLVLNSKGFFNLSLYDFHYHPGENLTYFIKTNIFQSYLSANSSYFTESQIDQSLFIKFRYCIRGERLTDDFRCQSCPNNTYSFQTNFSNRSQCLSCQDENFYCYGKDLLTPKPGYWRYNTSSLYFLKCPNKLACLGSTDPTLPHGICYYGYKGVFCAQCEEGFSINTDFECSDCWRDVLYYVKFGAYFLFIIIYTVITVSTNLDMCSMLKDGQPKMELILRSQLLTILTNHLQSISIIMSSFTLEWPPEYNYLNFLMYLGTRLTPNPAEIFSQYCIFEVLGVSYSPFYVNLISVFLAPIYMSIIGYLFWAIYFRLKRKQRRSKEFALSLRTTINILLFYVYPFLLSLGLDSFNCINVNSPEEPIYYLAKDYSIRCWTGTHLNYIFFLVIPGLLSIGFFIPITLFLKLHNLYGKGKLTHSSKHLFKYGFLFFGFERGSYYWEFVILIRKVALIIVKLYWNEETVARGLLLQFIIFFSLYVHSVKQPYSEINLNKLESKSLKCTALLIYAWIYFLGRSQEGKNETIGVLLLLIFYVLAVNLYFMLPWLSEMIMVLRVSLEETEALKKLEKIASKICPCFIQKRKRLATYVYNYMKKEGWGVPRTSPNFDENGSKAKPIITDPLKDGPTPSPLINILRELKQRVAEAKRLEGEKKNENGTTENGVEDLNEDPNKQAKNGVEVMNKQKAGIVKISDDTNSKLNEINKISEELLSDLNNDQPPNKLVRFEAKNEGVPVPHVKFKEEEPTPKEDPESSSEEEKSQS